MLEKLRQMEENYHAMQEKMMDPAVVGDNQQYAQLMREYKHMQPIIEKYHEYLQAQNDFTEAREILDGEEDAELREMAQAELEQSKERMDSLHGELMRLLLPKDPDDDRNVIIEIRGGAGGEEASLFAASLYRMYTMYAETQGWKQEVLSANETELGGYKEISFSILGEGAYSRLKYESGVHRVQRVPDGITGTNPHLHSHCCGAGGSGRSGSGHQSHRSADRCVPCQRCRRTAYQQNRISSSHHAYSHWSGRRMSGRTKPV